MDPKFHSEEMKEDRIISSRELFEELQNLPKQKGFSSGYPTLDFFLKEFREGDLIILSGLTGEGKTQMAISLTKKFLEQKINPLWFSFEISSQELFERFGKNIPTFYLPRLITSKAAEWIEKKIVEAKKKHDVKVVFIDHLHYLTDDASVRSRNLSEILGALCRHFKMVARRERVIIFCLCHIRKVKAEKERPTIDDLKDSSGIAQEADTVLIVQRRGHKRGKKKGDGENTIEISTDIKLWIDKNRRTGHLGAVDMYFDPPHMIHREAGEMPEDDEELPPFESI